MAMSSSLKLVIAAGIVLLLGVIVYSTLSLARFECEVCMTFNGRSACRVAAPDNYTRNEDGGYSYVDKQPENDEEYAMCLDAMDGCPVESIGEDGDE